MIKISEVKLIALKEDIYSIYVFQDLNTKEFIMCTRLPNWQIPEIFIGNEGFLKYQYVKAGEEYYDPQEQKYRKYLYTNVYLINFILKTDIIKGEEIIL